MEQKRVWIYCRVDRSDACNILETQKECLCHYAKANGLLVEGVTSEYGSGTTLLREGLNEVSAAAQAGRMEILLLANISRIGRNAVETGKYVNWLETVGVEVVSVVPEPVLVAAQWLINLVAAYP